MKVLQRLVWIGLFFLVLTGPGQAQNKVVEVQVKGQLRKVAESLVLTTAGLKPGVELSMENVQQAVRDLQALNVFEDIQIFGDPVSGGVVLIIMVEEYPSLEGVRFKGHKHLKEKEMKDALGLVAGQVVAPKDVVRGQQKILDLYREKGYLRALVKGKTFAAEEEGKVFLQYDIQEGEKVQIRKVRIVQHKVNGRVVDSGELPPRNPRQPLRWELGGPSPEQLKSQMETKEKHWWRKGEFKGETYAEDKQKILALYRSLGYQQAAILRDSVYYDESRRDLFVDIEIEEGLQYYLGEMGWKGNEIFTDQELADRLKLVPGDLYGLSGPELADIVRFAYYEKGYLDTRVVPVEEVQGDTIDVSFQIFEGQPWTIRRIEIAGNTKTREKVIRREIELRPGDIYQQNLVQESQRRIFVLNFFKDVQIQPEYSPVEGERLVDLTFNVEERPTGQASMGAGYSDRDKLVGQIGLQIPNFRGLGQGLDFNWEFGTRREQFLVGFTEPWLFDTPTSLSVRVYTLNNQYFNLYDYRRNSVSARLGRRLKKPAYSSLSIGYRLENERYADFREDFDTDLLNDARYARRYAPRTTSSFEMVYSRDTRNHSQFPSKGTLFSYQPEVASSLLAGEVDFHKHQVNFNYYRPSWWKFVISLESKAAIVDGFSDYDDRNLSIWELFQPGGVDWWDGQVRGYPDRSLGPRVSKIPVGGRSMMVLNLEYRFPIAEQQVYGLLFADAGNAWERIPDLNPLDLRRSMGFGFRIMTPMLGMIGFDFGYGFDRPKVDEVPAGWTTHFQFGPRFF